MNCCYPSSFQLSGKIPLCSEMLSKYAGGLTFYSFVNLSLLFTAGSAEKYTALLFLISVRIPITL